MRYLFPLLLLVLLGVVPPAVAKDQPAPVNRRLTPGQTADEVLKAHGAADEAALKDVAARDVPDPWRVAEALCVRGEHDAAAAFADAAPRPALEKLRAYVDLHRKQEADPAIETKDDVRAAWRKRDWKEVVALCEAIPDGFISVTRIGLARWFHGPALIRSDRRSDAIGVFERAARDAEALGWLFRAADLHVQAGEQRYALGDAPKALDHLRHAIAHFRTLGDRFRVAGTTLNMGMLQDALGEHQKALETLASGYREAEALDHRQWMADALGNMGTAHFALGNFAEALDHYKRALKLNEGLKNDREIRRYLRTTGQAYLKLGRYRRATAHHQRALKLAEDAKDEAALAESLRNVGALHNQMGHYAKALAYRLRALEYARKTKNRKHIAHALHVIGTSHWHMGDLARANDHFERALDGYQQIQYKVGISNVLINLGLVQRDLGSMDAALEYFERARQVVKERGDKYGTARVLGILADFHEKQGKHALARKRADEALVLYQEAGDRSGVAETHARIGWLQVHLNERDEGLGNLQRAVRLARPLRNPNLYVWCLQRLAWAYLKGGEYERALTRAHDALDEIECFVEGLAEEQGALARKEYKLLFEIGALAAAQMNDAAEAITFLESGRAGGLLEALTSRQSLRWTEVPAALRQDDAKARAEVEQAREAYLQAAATGQRKPKRKARTELRIVIDRLRDVADRIQRESKGQSVGLPYPRAESIEGIQAELGKSDAFVIYGLALDQALAVVLTADTGKVVRLGAAADVRSACESFAPDDRKQDPTAKIEALRKALVDPLSLGKDVKRVLVSPEGPLCYLPFRVLFSQELAYTPSGTTHAMLRADPQEPGTRVFALGNPNYEQQGGSALYRGAGTLVALPGTGPEATAIGDEVLLGPDATEASLREVLKKEERWRAVHFACHGLVDPERPSLCALAVTPGGNDDGFLTGLEVLTMDIPADLAVLSACDTGKGKIIDGEGLLGLTRSFMFAGAPRVICSLWKVDDKATQALMRKFYELWNPEKGKQGMSTAAALQAAQSHVRKQEKWKHPYFWAAWVLWGLPD